MNNKMNIEETYSTVADVSNSLYNLARNQVIDAEDYAEIKQTVQLLYSQIGRAILSSNKGDK